MKNDAFAILLTQQTEEATRVLNLVAAARERIVIYDDREFVMRNFLELTTHLEERNVKIGVRKLAKFLDVFFDFRRFGKPNESLGVQSLETKLFEMKRRMEGRDD